MKISLVALGHVIKEIIEIRKEKSALETTIGEFFDMGCLLVKLF